MKKHYWLVAASVTFVKDEDVATVTMNTMVNNDKNYVNIRMIARAQQAVQMNLFEKTGDPSLNVIDVVILNMSYLGEMTEKELQEGAPTPTAQPANG